MAAYKILRSGQPRPYADSETVTEVYLNEGLTKEQVSDLIRSMNIGFDDSSNLEWYQPKLQYLRESSLGVWEFNMVSAYAG